LVDLGGPVIQARIHGSFSYAVAHMVRPTHSRLVTEFDIGRAFGRCNMLKTKSSDVQIVGIFAFAVG
jgi:hypothetical protein